jgi:flagellar biosynthesis chaperone FliJ
VDYLKKEIENHTNSTQAVLKKWNSFKANLLSGIDYYDQLLSQKNSFDKSKTTRDQLNFWRKNTAGIEIPILKIV